MRRDLDTVLQLERTGRSECAALRHAFELISARWFTSRSKTIGKEPVTIPRVVYVFGLVKNRCKFRCSQQ